jgi:2-oxoglutarate decarboxylase
VNNPNIAFENELYFQYLRDPESVSPEWKAYFERINGKSVSVISDINTNTSSTEYSQNITVDNHHKNTSSSTKVSEWEQLEALSTISAKIADNMEDSLDVPTATSFRTIPVKALEENRRIINNFLEKTKRNKISFSQVLLWAIVRALSKYPRMNDSFERIEGKAYRKVRKSVNIGVAVDMTRKDGTRLLMVPSIKNAQELHFAEFISSIENIIAKTRNSKLSLDDLEGTTVTLTNPGMIGTNASVPRLMKGQGLIIAAGAIDYPNEFQAVRPDLIASMAVSKVVQITSTYDHRIIQGAESAEFLLYIHKLLTGEYFFYDQIFASLKIPYTPVKWESDAKANPNNLTKEIRNMEKSALVMQLVNSYRTFGHLAAAINPLGMDSYAKAELDPANYGFNIWDLDRNFPTDSTWGKDSMPLRNIIDILRDTYTGSIGIEYMHISDTYKKNWIKQYAESSRLRPKFSNEDKIKIYKKLVEAESFEGSESIIVLLDQIFESSADADLHSIVIGMAHRGRLNVLVNNIGKKMQYVFDEFEGNYGIETGSGSGDVKYHLGAQGTYVNKNNKSVNIRLAPNPSHLEIINPVVIGMARAIEREIKDPTLSKCVPILIHGDSALAGQGIGQETLNMSNLEGYKVGGTIHIVINNQIGFTTTAEAYKSTTYCTDIAKMLDVPILHVNGNDPEAVALAGKMAIEYRNNFGTDVFIDLLSFRKYGHNEGDEPSYTQPLLYKKIKSMKAVRELYLEELIKSSVLTNETSQAVYNQYKVILDQAFDTRKEFIEQNKLIDDSKIGQTVLDIPTNITVNTVEKVINAITEYPSSFHANPKVVGGLKKRKEMILTHDHASIDWATAEALAFGSLLLEGKDVRLSGEDSQRGTFSQRHAVLVDHLNEDTYIPLNHIEDNQGTLRIYDSPLSELGVLGFDYGYSVISNNMLTLWEAQFGDFANMAQPIIDQFVCCAEVKWGQTSNLVMLLPHGQDGQGPEHSSARLERFLQLCADENMIVCNFTSPAQYFHALRRQLMLKTKVPMILMTPKGMLRHPLAVSRVRDFTDYTFRHVIDDADNTNPAEITKVLLCSGKIYYELLAAKREANINHIAIIRVEQLYPLHGEMIQKFVSRYSNVKDILWVQEEPKNQGAWSYIAPELSELLDGRRIQFAGRPRAAATAPGSQNVHAVEQKAIVDFAIFGKQ